MFYVLAAFVLLVMVAWMVLQPLLRGDQSVADAEVADDEVADAEVVSPGTVADDEGEVVDLEAMIAERRRRMAAAEKEVQP